MVIYPHNTTTAKIWMQIFCALLTSGYNAETAMQETNFILSMNVTNITKESLREPGD